MKRLTVENSFAFLVLFLFCTIAVALPACSIMPTGGQVSVLSGLTDTQWNERDLQTELRAEQTLWTDQTTRLKGSARLLGNIGGDSSFEGFAGPRLESGNVGADLLFGSDRRLLGMDWTWQPLHRLKLKMGLQHDGEVIQASTQAALNLTSNWALLVEYDTSETDKRSLLGLRGNW